VLELGTWQTTYSGAFRPVALSAQFFGDSDRLLVQSTASRVLVDITTGARTERPYVYERTEREDYYAAGTRTLLCVRQDSLGGEARTLALLEFPGYRQIGEVPYADHPRKPHPIKGGFALRADLAPIQADTRKVLAYSYDNVLVCRRTENLALIWTSSVEPAAEFINLAISADAARIAASVGDPSVNDITRSWRQHYLVIYDGGSGEEITRLQVDGTEGIALSPHGKLIAAISHEQGDKGTVVPTVSLYDVSSAKKVASVAHSRVKRGRHQWLEAGITVAFTSDRKYMVTSGMATRIWKLDDILG